MLHEKSFLSQEDVRIIEGKAMCEILVNRTCSNLSGSRGTGSHDQEILQAGHTVRPADCLFFDIETTGLSAETSFIFLIGCIGYEDEGWTLHQFFIRMVQEEKTLLSAFFDVARNYRVLIHFNGTTFDLPFIRKRAAANHLIPVTDSLISIDLYRRFSPLRKLLGLPHMNQSFLEAYVGWKRDDRMSGKEVVSLFWSYSVSKNPEKERLLLLHNHDDLLGMLHVSAMEAYFSLLSGKIHSNIKAMGSEEQNALLLRFETELDIPSLLDLSVCAPSDHSSNLSGKQALSSEAVKNSSGRTTLRAKGSAGQLSVPIYCGTLRYFFPDYRNYYFLPLENQAIHKSVASYVAKEYRIPAKPENCFAEKSGRFLPIPSQAAHDETLKTELAQAPFYPALRENYDSKTSYFDLKEFLNPDNPDADNEALLIYTQMLLRSF